MTSDKLTEQMLAAAIEVHRILGPGLLESIYEEALCHEMDLRNMSYERQKEIDVVFKGKIITGRQRHFATEITEDTEKDKKISNNNKIISVDAY